MGRWHCLGYGSWELSSSLALLWHRTFLIGSSRNSFGKSLNLWRAGPLIGLAPAKDPLTFTSKYSLSKGPDPLNAPFLSIAFCCIMTNWNSVFFHGILLFHLGFGIKSLVMERAMLLAYCEQKCQNCNLDQSVWACLGSHILIYCIWLTVSLFTHA